MAVGGVTLVEKTLERSYLKWATALVCLFSLVYYPMISRVVQYWWYDPDYGHGFLIAPLALFLVWQKRVLLMLIPITQDRVGFPVLISGLLLLLLGSLGRSEAFSQYSFPVVLSGLLLYLVGRRITAEVAFPIAFLIFMFPIPSSFYNRITLPLKLLTSFASATLIQLLEIPVYREGNILQFANIDLEVATACSGIRSLISLMALAGAIAYLTRCSAIKKILLFLAAIPIAMAANIFRTTVTALLAHNYGPKMAEGFFHEFSGLVIFLFSIVTILILRAVLAERQK